MPSPLLSFLLWLAERLIGSSAPSRVGRAEHIAALGPASQTLESRISK